MVATLLRGFMYLSEVVVRTWILDLAFVLAGCKFSFLENHDNFANVVSVIAKCRVVICENSCLK